MTKTESETDHILCVDDDDDTCLVLSALLRSSGYAVTTAKTAAEGLERVKNERFDLIILDTWIPQVSGIDLCKEIRAFDAGIPIMFYSAVASEKEIQRALAAGGQAYLIKPGEAEELERTIARLIQDSRGGE